MDHGRRGPESAFEVIFQGAQVKSVLFPCVANSARSQMDGGITRSLAPPDMKIWPAGSCPTSVRPEASAAPQPRFRKLPPLTEGKTRRI